MLYSLLSSSQTYHLSRLSWKIVCVLSGSVMTLWTVAHQAPLSMGFPMQEYWSGLPFPLPRDLPDPGIKPMPPVSSALKADSLPPEPKFSNTLDQFSKPGSLCTRRCKKYSKIQTWIVPRESSPDLQLHSQFYLKCICFRRCFFPFPTFLSKPYLPLHNWISLSGSAPEWKFLSANGSDESMNDWIEHPFASHGFQYFPFNTIEMEAKYIVN